MQPTNTDRPLRVLTFNLGLLRVRLFGISVCTIFSSPPYLPQRLDAILLQLPVLLAERKVDVCALQEIYEESHVEALLSAVQAEMPYHARVSNNRCYQFHNGLLILSRVPIDAVTLEKHKQASVIEMALGCKSCLCIHVTTHLGKISFVNLHTTSSDGVDSVRQNELEEAMVMCETAHSEGYAAAIIGDLNMGPETSKPNYDFLLSSGYSDIVSCRAPNIGATWDPNSPLNNTPIFANSPPQRIDHFFVHESAHLVAVQVEKVFAEPSVVIPLKKGTIHVTLSDHFGLLVDVVKVVDMLPPPEQPSLALQTAKEVGAFFIGVVIARLLEMVFES